MQFLTLAIFYLSVFFEEANAWRVRSQPLKALSTKQFWACSCTCFNENPAGAYFEFSPLPEREGGLVQVDLSISFETVTEWGQPYITNAHTQPGRAGASAGKSAKLVKGLKFSMGMHHQSWYH